MLHQGLTNSAVLVRLPNCLQISRRLHKTGHHLSLSPNILPVESEKVRAHPRRHSIRRIVCIRHRLSV